MASWIASIFNRLRGNPSDRSDPVNVALVDAYTALIERERDYMTGRLVDNAFGIQRRPLYISTRYQPRDRDEILAACESGQMLRLAFFLDFLKQDGLVSGLMGTRTGGMLRQPVLYSGDPFLVEALKGCDPVYGDDGLVLDPGKPGLWSRMVPTAELSKIISDGILAGIGIGELIADETGLPVLRHLDLHWLRYEYSNPAAPDGRWIYQTPNQTAEVRPGDGRWVVFTPKGDRRPWIHAAWFPLAYPVISKAGTVLDRLRWQGQLADPLKVIESSQASSPRMRNYLMDFIKNKWRRAPGLVTLPNEKAYLVESSGRGYDVYNDAEARADREIQFILSGQVVTGDGNKGFSSGDIYEAIKNDLIQETADSAAECVHRDILGPWAWRFYGIREAPAVQWDVRAPAQRKAEAEAITEAMDAIDKASSNLAKYAPDLEVDVQAFLKEQRINLPLRPKCQPLAGAPSGDGPPSDESASKLAEKMTLHGIERCEHGSSNRCRLCGVERVRDFDPGIDGGQHTWRKAWRPIAPSPSPQTNLLPSAGSVQQSA